MSPVSAAAVISRCASSGAPTSANTSALLELGIAEQHPQHRSQVGHRSSPDGVATEVNDRQLYGETLTWFRFTPEEIRERPDGLNLKTSDADTASARAFLRPSNWHKKVNRRLYLKRLDASIDSTTALVVVSSRDHTMRDWIISGQVACRWGRVNGAASVAASW